MKNKINLILGLFLIVSGCVVSTEKKEQENTKEEFIVRYDRPEASILKGVYIPKGKEYFYTSGLVAPIKDESAPIGSPERYGDTYEQSLGTLERIKETIAEAGFKMEDIFFLRVYLAPDKEGNIDWDAWFKAYGEYFNNEENPNKVARSTIAVYALANPDLLIEIEAVAAK
ncbi:Enamine deaminase RidA, house cleaning of reactive enamine intermediates, YjgF/YER057c/UK114 family [Aquiflexum balticum DSM 16537]|uniref:Enamine deaminase RidA, house cleaning of reactive enamine intermediates, YjgF/YER057c/UK114 family n=1 Tax=Aquiflexum balticum DSM 16537 TaxID=758820 RepID=A0A1W2H367_9BACT|nr:RidA family protein [Aquiflexum balticum]SMD43082.1 Enamine deaminase RidA, house cleaning of reactive enamine intermediates, YjgF/YER057c/UK114 family [Aquiflexum balticum DSM 16537]